MSFCLKKTVERLYPRSTSLPLGVAVSGGADSLALLKLAADAYGDRAHILTVDHGYRAEATTEADTVISIARQLGLPCHKFSLGLPYGANLQAEARQARYQVMTDYARANSLSCLLTAHHLDDQAQTLLMRAARGSGLTGMAGIRPLTLIFDFPIVRPLLSLPQQDLIQIATSTGWPMAHDPSNHDIRYDRTKVRALLASDAARWIDARRLAETASHLNDAEEALQWAVDRAWASQAEHHAEYVRLHVEGLPNEIKRRLLTKALAIFDTLKPDGPSLKRLTQTLEAGGTGTLGKAQASVGQLGRTWILKPAPPHKN